MMSLIAGLLCLAIPMAAIITAGVLLVARQKRLALERQQGMAAYSAQREWRFRPDGMALESRFRGDPFGKGSSRTARNSVEGTYEGRPFVAFDYSYVTTSSSSNGTSSTTHRFSVVAMHLGCTVPKLQVRPQSALGRFFSGLFGTDLIIGQPGFDDTFHVSADNPQFAHDVLHPGLTAMLAGYQDRAWRLQDDSLLMFRTGNHTAQEIDQVLWSMKAILDQIPAPVWSRLRGER